MIIYSILARKCWYPFTDCNRSVGGYLKHPSRKVSVASYSTLAGVMVVIYSIPVGNLLWLFTVY